MREDNRNSETTREGHSIAEIEARTLSDVRTWVREAHERLSRESKRTQRIGVITMILLAVVVAGWSYLSYRITSAKIDSLATEYETLRSSLGNLGQQIESSRAELDRVVGEAYSLIEGTARACREIEDRATQQIQEIERAQQLATSTANGISQAEAHLRTEVTDSLQRLHYLRDLHARLLEGFGALVRAMDANDPRQLARAREQFRPVLDEIAGADTKGRE